MMKKRKMPKLLSGNECCPSTVEREVSKPLKQKPTTEYDP
jgi:hypothetical protein